MSYEAKQNRRGRGARSLSRGLLCGASLAAAIVALGTPPAARAEDRYWDANGTAVGTGGAGTWNLGNLNWSPSGDGVSGPYVSPWSNVALDNAIFGGTAGTVTLNVPVTVYNLTFNTTNYILTGSTLTLAGASPTITSSGNATINSVLAGSSGLIKAGAGSVILNGINTFTGDIYLNSGGISAATDAALGAGSNNIFTGAGASVALTISGASTSREIHIGDGGTLTLGGSGAGSALVSGNGTVAVGNGVTMSNDANSYTGRTTFRGTNGVANFYFTSIGNLGEASSLGAPVTVEDGAIFFNQSSQYSDNVIYLGDGDSSNRNWQLNGTTALIRNRGTGTLSITGDIITSGGSGFFAENADIDLLGVLSGGNYGFSAGAGRVITLGGANSFTGLPSIGGLVRASVLANTGAVSSLGAGSNITLNAGVLSYIGTGNSSDRLWAVNGASSILNDGTGALDLSGGATFTPGGAADSLTLGGSFNGVNSYTGVISGIGDLISDGAGTWVLGGANDFTGGVTVNAGTLKAGSASAFGTANGLIVNGGTLDLGGYNLVAPSLTGTGGTVALGSASLTVDTVADDGFAGIITGAGGLIKAGKGFLTLSGANTYTGATRVNGGILALGFNNFGSPVTDIISSASTLNMAGGTLSVFGGSGADNIQTFNGLNIVAGNNRIGAQASSTGSVTINFGAINRTGGLINFVLPAAGNFTTSNTSLGGWATINGTDYAKVVDGNIVAFIDADYTDQDDASLWADGQYISDSDGDAESFFGTVTSDVQLAGLQFTTVDPITTVTIDPTATVGIDGTIIVSSSVGSSNQTIAGGSVTGGSGDSTLGVQQNSAGIFTIGSTIVNNGGATSFAKSGNGIVRLAGANSYSGGTTLSGGTLEVTNLANGGVNSSIGASTADSANLVLESGTLAYVGGTDATSDRGFTLVNGGAERAIQVDASRTVEFSGLVTSPDDAGLTKTGWGTLVLSNAANDYVGVTTITGSGAGGASTLSVNTLSDGGTASGIGAATSDSANLVMSNGGRLQYTGDTVEIDRGFTLADGQGGIDVAPAGTTLTITGIAAGPGSFVKHGDGTLVLGGASTYTGDTIVNGGTLRAGSAQAFGPGGRYMTVNGGATLELGGFNISSAAVIGGGLIDLGGNTLTTAGGSGVFTGRITGTGGYTRGGGSYTQTLNGCNNDYTGATTISSGLAIDCIANGGQASAIGASAAASSNLVFAGGTLAYTGTSVATDRGFTLAGNSAINVVDAGTTLEFSGAITGGGQLAKTGAGTLLLSGANSSTNNLRVIGGTVRLGSTSALGAGGLSLDNTAGVLLDLDGYDNTVLNLVGGGTLGGNIALGGATLTITNGGSAAANFGGEISGSGGLIKTGGAFQQLTGCSSSYGGTTVINQGILAVACLTDGGATSSIGSSSSAASNLVLSGGTLQYVGTGGATNRQFTLGASTTSKLDASGTGAIEFTHAGPLTFASADTAQTLTLGGTSTANNILAAQIINNGTGVTRLTKTDAGTWILTNSGSTYTGITTISGGVLGVDKLADGGVASSIGMSSAAASNLVIGNGSTLRYTGAGDTTNRLFTLSSGVTFIESSGTGAIVFTDTGPVTLANNNQARTIALGGANTGNNTLAGSIGNAGSGITTLAKNDSGTWVLTGNHTYTGSTNINGGILSIGGGGTTGSVASATVNNFGTLAFNRSDSLTFGGAIVGTGALRQDGVGTTILTGINAYSGGTTINAGTLQLGDGGTTGVILGDVTNDGTFAFNRSNDFTFGGIVRGTGLVHQMGPGVVALTGVNTYGGGTIISGGGTLQIVADNNMGDAAGDITFDNGTLRLLNSIISDRNIVLAGAGTFDAIDGSDWTVTGDITGAGSLTTNGLSGTLILTDDATHTGGTITNAGSSLQIGGGGTTGTLAGDILNNGFVTFNRSDSYTYAGQISGSGSVSTTGGGIITLTADSSYGGNTSVSGASELLINAGNTVTSGGSTSVNNGTLTVSDDSTFVTTQITAVSPSQPTVINVEDGGTLRTTTGGLAIRGSGLPSNARLNISGDNALVDLAGALEVASSGATSTATIMISDGGTLLSTGNNLIGTPTGNSTDTTITITGAGSNWTSTGSLVMRDNQLSVLDGGAASFNIAQIGTVNAQAQLLVSGAGSTFTTTQGLTVGALFSGSGTLTIAEGARVTAGTGITIAGPQVAAKGIVNIGGVEGGAAVAAGFVDGAIIFGPGTGRLNFNHTDTDYEFGSVISGAGTINQVAGVTDLTGISSAFAGTTNVSGGTLRVNGTLGNATSALNVLTGATLGGAGTIGGNVDIASGGILAPGNSPGTLTIGGNLTLSGGSILNYEFGEANVVGGPLNDLVEVGGNLTLGGTINVSVPAGGAFGGGIYRVFNYDGTLTNNGLNLGTMPDGSNVTVQTSMAGQVNLVNSTGLSLSFWDGDAGPKFNDIVNGGNGTWHLDGTDNNWTDETGGINAAYADGTFAIFAGTGGTVTVDNGDGAVTASGMQFASDDYLITGDALTLTDPQSIVRVGDGTATGAGFITTIAAELTGAAELVKTDAGTLVLGRVNSYTGGTRINGGVLSVRADSFLGASTGGVTLDGGTLQLTDPTFSSARAFDLGAASGAIEVTNPTTVATIINGVTGSGGLTKLGAGTLQLGRANSYTGGTTIEDGTLFIGSFSGNTTASIVGDVVNNGTLRFGRADAYTYAGSITGTGFLDIVSTGVTTLTGNSSYGGGTRVSGANGELRIVDEAKVTSGGATTMGRSTLSIDGAGSEFSTASIGGNIPGIGSAIVRVTNGGTLRTTTGDIGIRALTNVSVQLNIDGANSLADLTGGVQGSTSFNAPFSTTVSAGGTLRTAGASQIGLVTSTTNPIAVAITGAGSNWTSGGSLLMTAGNFTVDQGGAASFTSATFGTAPQAAGLSVSGASSSFATTGDLVIGSGSGTGALTLADGARVDVGGAFMLADNAAATGILNIGGAEGSAAAAAGVFDAPTLNLGSVTSRVNFNHTETDYDFASAMSGTGAINQAAGITRLTGDSSAFTGTTSVSGGTLLVNGTLGDATSLANVLAGGTLGGTGTIGGDVGVDGRLAAGSNGVGVLTISGTLDLTANAQLDFEFGRANMPGDPLNDLVNVGGDLTLDGTINVAVSPGGSFDIGLYRVFNYGGELTDNDLTVGTMPAGVDPNDVSVQTSVVGQVNLVNTNGATLNFWDGAAGPKFDNVINGGDGVWQNSTGNDNWTDASGAVNAPFTDSAIAIFSAASGTVTVDDSLGAVSAGGMQFASDGYVITGDAVTLVNPQSVIRVGDGTTGSSNYTATINSVLTGAAQLVKTDLGTLVLTGTNTYNGGTTIDAGTLQLGDGGTSGSILGDVAINSGELVFNRSDDVIFSGAISGAGDITQRGAGTTTLTGNSNLAGGVYINGGTLQISDGGLVNVDRVVNTDGSVPSFVGIDTNLIVTGAGSAFTTSNDLIAGRGADTASITVDNGGHLTAGRSFLGEGSNSSTASAINVIVDGVGSIFNAGSYFHLGAAAGGTASLTISGGGVMQTVAGGTGSIGRGGDGSALVTGAGSQLVSDDVLYIGESFNGGAGHGQLTIQDGGLVTASMVAMGYNDAVTSGSTGALTILGTAGSRGVLETGSLSRGFGDASITLDGGLLRATADNADYIENLGADEFVVTLGGGGGFIDTNGHAIGIAPRFDGAGGLTKQGAGVLTLAGDNTYLGATTVSAGMLLVNGDQSAASGLTTVNSGATIGGIGTIGGNVIVADGAALNPGDLGTAPGTLTIAGNLDLAATSTLNVNFGQANIVGGTLNDLVEVGGDLTLGGTLNVQTSAGGSFDPGIYRIINYAGNLAGSGLAIGTIPSPDFYVQTSIANQVNLVNTSGLTFRYWDGVGVKNDGVIDGGNGVWQNTTGNDNWVDDGSIPNAQFADSAFAVFLGVAGTITVDESLGAVNASGMQFLTDGYAIGGDAITLVGSQAVIRVGDGTAAGAGTTATIGAELTGATQLVKSDLGTLILTGSNSYAGGTAINGGVLRVSADANLGDATGGLSFDGGTLQTTADLSSDRAIDLIGTGTLATDAALDLTGVIGGAGSLIKDGNGTLTLTGMNTYAGGASVNAGALLVNGDQSAAGGLTSVASGAMLGGIGTIGGDVAIADGATLDPGGADGLPGTLTIAGNLTLASGSTLSMQFGEANAVGGALNDLIEVGGDLVLDGTLDVSVPPDGDFGPGIYRVLNYGGTLTNNGLELGSMPSGSISTVQTSIAGQVNLVNTDGSPLNFWDGDAGPKFNNQVDGGDGLWQSGGGNDNWTDAGGAVNATYADGAFAIFAGAGGDVAIDNSLGEVTASGMQFAANGYNVGGEALRLTGGQATIRVGDGSTAGADFTATIAAELTGTARLVKTDAGTLILSGTNSYTGGTVIEGGTLTVSADANLGDAAGNVGFDGGTLRTTASLASNRAFAFAGNGTILTDQATVFTLNGPLSGSGVFTKDGAGILLLTGDSSAFASATQVAGGTLAVDGVLGGVVAVASAGRLTGNGQVGGIGNAGVVAPGASIGTLTVAGDYAGNGGILEIEAVLGDDSSATDRLVVNGATSGNTQVRVINRDGLGAQTIEGIKIVDVVGTSNGTFALSGDYVFQGDQTVIGGAYGYRLYQGGIAQPADGDWYLRSSLLNPIDPEEPVDPEVPNPPLYQPGVPVYEAYGANLQALNGLPTLQQRIGNRSWAAGANPEGSGIWGRMEGIRSRANAAVSTSLADQNVNSWKMQLGADRVLTGTDKGERLVAGITAYYGEANSHVRSIFGNGSLKTDGYGVSATLSWYGLQGLYIDGQAQFSWYETDLNSAILGKLARNNDGNGEAFSVEIGKRSSIGNKLSVTPQMQMVYSNVRFDRFIDPAGAIVAADKGDSLKTRWGLSLDHQAEWDNGRSHVYGLVNLNYEWLDGTRTNVSGTPISHANERLWGELGIGASIGWTNGVTLYGEVSGNSPFGDFGDSYMLKANAGVRIAF